MRTLLRVPVTVRVPVVLLRVLIMRLGTLIMRLSVVITTRRVLFAQFCELLLRLAVAMVNAADFDREFTTARFHQPHSAHPAGGPLQIASHVGRNTRAAML